MVNYFFYRQQGTFYLEDQYLSTAYSGHGPGLNNPNFEEDHDVGPIPAGKWLVGVFFDHPHLGPFVAHLSPFAATKTYGRVGFLIHGDNTEMNHSASDGCIILERPVREKMSEEKEHIILNVV